MLWSCNVVIGKAINIYYPLWWFPGACPLIGTHTCPTLAGFRSNSINRLSIIGIEIDRGLRPVGIALPDTLVHWQVAPHDPALFKIREDKTMWAHDGLKAIFTHVLMEGGQILENVSLDYWVRFSAAMGGDSIIPLRLGQVIIHDLLPIHTYKTSLLVPVTPLIAAMANQFPWVCWTNLL